MLTRSRRNENWQLGGTMEAAGREELWKLWPSITLWWGRAGHCPQCLKIFCVFQTIDPHLLVSCKIIQGAWPAFLKIEFMTKQKIWERLTPSRGKFCHELSWSCIYSYVYLSVSMYIHSYVTYYFCVFTGLQPVICW